MKMFAIRDLKSQVYLKPMFQSSIADATRNWEIISNDSQSLVSRFPHDFRLHCLADFDVNTGDLDPFPQPQDLGSAADFVKKDQQASLPLERSMSQ